METTWAAPTDDRVLSSTRYRELLSVDPMSACGIVGAMYGGLGVFVGIMAVLFALVRLPAELPFVGTILAFGVFAPFLYGAMGALFGLLAALFYNLAALLVGGIQLELKRHE